MYAYLDKEKRFLVIIAINLLDKQESDLLKVFH